MLAWEHTCNIYEVDDRGTGTAMGRKHLQTLVGSDLPCRVSERNVLHRTQAHGRDTARHTHMITFPDNPGANGSHVIEWTPTGETDPVYLAVITTLRPSSSRMPWTVVADRIESGIGQ